jgi:hypothetical protein
MTFDRFVMVVSFLGVVAGCGGGSSPAPAPSAGGGGGGGTGTGNVVPITVTGTSLSDGSIYINKPTVSVTLCTPDGSSCQTIGNLLLDTGSYGLRIFRNVAPGVPLVTVPLRLAKTGAQTVAECVRYADGSSTWGPVANARVILGTEPAVQVPIQLVDASFAGNAAGCPNPDLGPASAGFNGILGVGIFAEDCGDFCVSHAGNGRYFACSGAGCSGTVLPLSGQVVNPVAKLPVDNNGVIVKLPTIPAAGAPSAFGTMVIGIATQTNNQPSGVTRYPASPVTGNFTTRFSGVDYDSFIDSGSNGLFFPGPDVILPDCGGINAGWYCPPASLDNPMGLQATNTGSGGAPAGTVSFSVGNFSSLFGSGNYVFSDIAGNFGPDFDWGLPFFFGRDVYVGIEGKGSSLGQGPYWAY